MTNRMTNRMTIEDMKRAKRAMGYSYEQIALRSGVPVGTVQKVLGGITASPRHETLCALEKAFADDGYAAGTYRTNEAEAAGEEDASALLREEGTAYRTDGLGGGAAAATAASAAGRTIPAAAGLFGISPRYPQQGSYTAEDYRALGAGSRTELIDGVLYEMEAPDTLHQQIAGRLYAALLTYTKAQEDDSAVLIAPVCVRPAGDAHTVLSPDVLVVYDRSKIKEDSVCGTPDFVAEVLSPAGRRRDMILKLAKYAEIGVREYWMIDPQQRKVTVYCFGDESGAQCPAVYDFEGAIPVAVYGGALRVEMREIAG